jgi:hypothetical protein
MVAPDQMQIRLALGLALLVLGPSAARADDPVLPAVYVPVGPVTALSGNQVVTAWAAGGSIWTATSEAGDKPGRSVAVGRSLLGWSPLLAADPNGDLVLVWAGPNGVSSAFRPAGARGWRVEPVIPGPVVKQALTLALDASGRAIVVDQGTGNFAGAFAIYAHDAGGSWTPLPITPGMFEGTHVGTSVAVDGAGDVAIAYVALGDPASLRASILRAGSAVWSDLVAVSIPNGSTSLFPSISGGGARTFVVALAGPNAIVAARFRAAGGWEPQQTIASAIATPPNLTTAVDAAGNATALWQAVDKALGFATLGTSEQSWSLPQALDQDTPSDSPPTLAAARDGSTAVAYLQRRPDGFWLRVATWRAPGAWLVEDVARVSACPATSICAWETLLAPSLAFDRGVLAVAAKTSEGVVFSTRAAGASWSAPSALQPAESTTAYLRSAHVRDGAVEVLGSCGLPPCAGTAVLSTLGPQARVLGRGRLLLLRHASGVYRRIVLPAWARRQLNRGERLRAQLVIQWVALDNIHESASRVVALHA